ncbi:hypothetical protein N2152v2_003676 [Parachlorella kessleri]
MNPMQQVLEDTLIRAAKHVEDQLDSQLQRLDNLDEDDIEKLRRQRLEDMKRMQQKRQEWAVKGHGEYRDIDERDFFKEMKGEERMVCHFYRESFPCKVMDKHMGILARKHPETKFVRVHAEKAPFLTDRLKVWMLPTLAVIRNEKTTDYIVGLDELGGSENFSTEALESRLVLAGVLFEDSQPRLARSGGEPAQQRTVRQSDCCKRSESDEDSDFE